MQKIFNQFLYSTLQISCPSQQIKKMSLKCTNYCVLEMTEKSIRLKNKTNLQNLFQLQYSKIKKSNRKNNVITVQTFPYDNYNEDCLIQIRFHVQQNKPEQVGGMEEQRKSYTDRLYQSISEITNKKISKGDSFVTVEDVTLGVPRGKYTMDFYQKNIRFHGITFNFEVEYNNIMRGFILPMANQLQICIVLQLEKAIRLGKSSYYYVIIQISKEVNITTSINISQQMRTKYNNLSQMQTTMQGPLFKILADLIHSIANINLIQPGNNFKSTSGQSCIKANVKAQSGWLYLLKQSIMFIIKPTIYFRIEDIKHIQFQRVTTSNRQFDLRVRIKNDQKVVEFMGIQREEFEPFKKYLKDRGVAMINTEEENAKITAQEQEQDQSEDEDFKAEQLQQSDGSSDSEESQEESQQYEQREDKTNNKGSKNKGKLKKNTKNKD